VRSKSGVELLTTVLRAQEYIEKVKKMSAIGFGDAGDLTPVGRGSYEIALLSAGGETGFFHFRTLPGILTLS
jgi:hypothetical protein